MWSSNTSIQIGDLVIVYLTRDNIIPLVIANGELLNTKFGNYRHQDFIGVPYGSKVACRTGRGFLYLLRPTPELWTLALPHRTQILYLADIAFITSRLNIKSGSRVIEAGTGSASFSHSIARTIGEKGHLWSYEFHETRANKAREEFTRHGMTDIVTLTHRNVCKDGFTVQDTVDSVFLDLPAPWDAVEHAKKALRKDRITRICCFSPCMEQVLRTVAALNEAGFTEIAMYETLLRPHDVSHIPQLQSISEVSEKLKDAEKRREDKRLRQIANNKRKREDDEQEDLNPVTDDQDAPQNLIIPVDIVSPVAKRVKMDEENIVTISQDMQITDSDEIEGAFIDDSHINTTTSSPVPTTSSPVPTTPRISVSNALPDVRGHTSYLTFAVLVPYSVVLGLSAESTSASVPSSDIIT